VIHCSKVDEGAAVNIEKELAKSKNAWELKVYQLIKHIPRGYVITYGGLARRANKKHGLRVIARNIGNLRNKLYHLLGHDSDVPLHRIAKKGDYLSEYDSPKTQKYNRRLRTAEGSWPEPEWLFG
jgi:alkylated DNA nucleotide flippase Atl1